MGLVRGNGYGLSAYGRFEYLLVLAVSTPYEIYLLRLWIRRISL